MTINAIYYAQKSDCSAVMLASWNVCTIWRVNALGAFDPQI